MKINEDSQKLPVSISLSLPFTSLLASTSIMGMQKDPLKPDEREIMNQVARSNFRRATGRLVINVIRTVTEYLQTIQINEADLDMALDHARENRPRLAFDEADRMKLAEMNQIPGSGAPKTSSDLATTTGLLMSLERYLEAKND